MGGLGTAGDFAGRDVRGKTIVIHTMQRGRLIS